MLGGVVSEVEESAVEKNSAIVETASPRGYTHHIRTHRLCAAIVLATAAVLVSLGLFHRLTDREFISYGGGLAIQQGALSVWNKGTFAAESFQAMHQQLLMQSAHCGCQYWQDVYGLGADERFYPVRALLLTAIAAPFVRIHEIAGLWIVNSLIFTGIVCTFFILNRSQTTMRASLVGTIGFVLGSGLIGYTYGIHYDLWALLLLLLGLSFAGSHPVWAGFLLGLMIETRPTHALFLPLLICAPRTEGSDASTTQLWGAASGVGAALLVIAYLNFSLWGSPLVTGFQRMPNYAGGQFFFSPGVELLNMQELAKNWLDKLFGPVGLITSTPIILPALVGFASWRSASGRFKVAVLGISFVHLLIFASSPNWADAGNLVRYFLPNVALLALGLGPLFASVRSKSSS